MPRSRPSIADPTINTNGIQLVIKRGQDGIVDVSFYYPPDPDGPFTVPFSALSGAQQTAVTDIVNGLIAAFKTARVYV